MKVGRCTIPSTKSSAVLRQIIHHSHSKSFQLSFGCAKRVHRRGGTLHAERSEESRNVEADELQRELEQKLTELAKVARHLSEEDQEKLAAVIAELGPLEDGFEEEKDPSGTAELPNPVKDLLNQAGVLDAVPYDGQPIIKDGTKLPLLTEPSLYQWGEDEDAKDTGRELTDEEWAEFFANELREDAGDSKEEEEVDDCQDDFTIPPSFADDEIRPGDDIEIKPSSGVEAMLAHLESGRPLPPDPREAGTTREPAAAFTARLKKIVARYEAQFLKRKEWQITTKEIRKMDERWEEISMKSENPTFSEDITEVTPAPDFPPEVQQQWDRCQWVLLRLRRAHMDGPPAQPAQALASAGLVAEDIIFRDALLECKGLSAWLEYAQHVEQTGGYIELANIWGSASEDRPDPQWHIVVDSWLNIPYPQWYLDYYMSHFDASSNPEVFFGAYAAAMAESGQGVPEGLEAHAEWARERLLPLKRKKKQALLSRDPYEGRPYSLQQRLRTGSTPVVEASPQLSIDDTDAQGRPLPGAADEWPEERSRTFEFVADATGAEAPFAAAARDPYGGGRHLLLPLLRRLQQSAKRLLTLLDDSSDGCSATHSSSSSSSSKEGPTMPPVSAAERSDGAYASGFAKGHSENTAAAGSRQEGGPDAELLGQSLNGAKGRGQTPEDADSASAASGSGAGAEWQRYRTSAAGAVAAARSMADQWRRERAELISWRSGEDCTAGPAGPLPSAAGASSASDARGAGQRGSILEQLKRQMREVKPGVSVWTDSSKVPGRGEVLRQLEELGAAGSAEAQRLADGLRRREGFLRRERPKQAPVQQEGAPPQTGQATKPDPVARGNAAPSMADEREAAAFSAAARRVRRERREQQGPEPDLARSTHGWSRHSLIGDDAGGATLKLLGAAELPGGGCSVRVAADGESLFASEEGSSAELHGFRLLLLSPRLRTIERCRLQRGADGAQTGSAAAAPGKPEASAVCFAVAADAGERKQEGSANAGMGTAAEGGEAAYEADPVAAAAAKLGLRPGAGSFNFPPAPGPLPAVPDLIRLLVGSQPDANSASTADDDSSAVNAPEMSSRPGSVAAERSDTEGDPAEASSSAGIGGKYAYAGSRALGGSMSGEEARKKAPRGMAWRDGRYMTIPMTTLYELDVETGQVHRITSHWNGMIAHTLGGPEDARDVYVRQTRLHSLMYRRGFCIRYRDLELTDVPAEEAMAGP